MYKALLVDDEPFILEGLKHIIDWEEHGIEIVGQVTSGEKAIRFLSDNSVHIMLTDIRMLGISGLDVISHIREKGLDVKCIVLSGYDDFELVKTAAVLGIENYLLKPVDQEELSITIQNTVSKLEQNQSNEKLKIHMREAIYALKDNVLFRLAMDRISTQELYNKASFLEVELEADCYSAVVIRRSVDSEPLFNYAIRNICEEITLTHNTGLVFENLDGNETIVMMKGDVDTLTSERMDIILNLMLDGINTYLKQDVFITVGHVVDNVSEFHTSYAAAKGLQDYSLVFPANRIVFYDAVERSRYEIESAVRSDFEELKRAIEQADKAAAVFNIRNLYEQLEQSNHTTPELVQSVTIEFVYQLVNSARIMGISTEHVPVGNEWSLKLLKLRKLQDIRDQVVQLAERIFEGLQAMESVKNPYVKDMLDYMNSNYNKDIGLQSLAQHLHINAAYLGQMFKKETGQLFSAYLNQIRINKAKELLEKTHMKANVIAQEVGYSSPDYFYKIFKKVTGVYPSDY